MDYIEDRNKRMGDDTVGREGLLTVLRAAQSVNAYRFIRQAVMEWLSIYPGDIEINHWLAKSLIGEGRLDQALEIIEKLCAIDPEYSPALRLAEGLYEPGSVAQVQAASQLRAQGHNARNLPNLLPWSTALLTARDQMKKEDYLAAEKVVYRVLNQYPDAVLGAILHLKLLGFAGDQSGVLSYSRVYHTRWPKCLHFSLSCAKAMLSEGNEAEAMQLFQQCVASDPEGRVAKRLWGNEHIYSPMWPSEMHVPFSVPVPADVASALGLNQLSAPKVQPAPDMQPVQEMDEDLGEAEITVAVRGEQIVGHSSRKDHGDTGRVAEANQEPFAASRSMRRRKRIVQDPELVKVEKTFDRLASKYDDGKLSQVDGRFPVYVVFSTRAGLEKKYGAQIKDVVENEMRRLAAMIAKYPDWDALVFLPDDPDTANRYGLDDVKATDPWSLKLSLADLDEALAKKGSMIGAVLIVGGEDVVPFHHLPNPTDDMDEDVPSDNPYATLDGNYFVPEWPVGRLPDEKGTDPAFLLQQIRKIISEHNSKKGGAKTILSSAFLVQIIAFIVSLFLKKRKPEKPPVKNGFGYSAAVWRRASISVFRPIGDGDALEISPPEPQSGFDYSRIMNAGLGYFNLHGHPDSAKWYGQRDITEPYVGPDYPPALKPSDLEKNSSSPRVVFTEACYGGHVFSKQTNESLALHFLSAGTSAVLASTCIAYGSINSPLIGADLLAQLFWQNLQDGMVCGEAFTRAKIDFVKQVEKRQGFLDGEDQKTMISFVQYGDPLACGNCEKPSGKSIKRLRVPVNVRMVCDIKANGEVECTAKGAVAEAKHMLKEYLPGVENADVSISQEYQIDNAYFKRKGFDSTTSSRSYAKGKAGRTVVTLTKQAKTNARTHHHYARVTLDKHGKMVKLAISR